MRGVITREIRAENEIGGVSVIEEKAARGWQRLTLI